MASFRAKHRRAVVKRQNSLVTLNLVSLTDFFTILLVFLLANSSGDGSADDELHDQTAGVDVASTSRRPHDDFGEQRQIVS